MNCGMVPVFAARQKDMAAGSVTELVEAVRRPRSLSESTNHPFIRKSGGGGGVVEKEEQEQELLGGETRKMYLHTEGTQKGVLESQWSVLARCRKRNREDLAVFLSWGTYNLTLVNFMLNFSL